MYIERFDSINFKYKTMVSMKILIHARIRVPANARTVLAFGLFAVYEH